MSLRDILTYPHPFLRTTTQPVAAVNTEIEQLIEDMIETMHSASGVGLAATQIGVDASIITYDFATDDESNQTNVLINPEITDARGSMVSEDEGCLSVPEYRADVKRAEWVRVEALDRNGAPIAIETDGFHAIVLQHEIDHLNGVLFIDRISALKRQLYKKRVKKMLRKT